MAIFNANQAGTLVHSIGTLANRSGNPGSIEQAVVDGDTLRVQLPGGQGLRFLGCDTPEKKIAFPLTPAEVAAGKKQGPFLQLDNARWDDFLDSAFDKTKWGAFRPALPASLRAHLEGRMRDDAARNHWTHAKAATEALQKLVRQDAAERQLANSDVKLFIAYAHEVLDRYGRPLVFANIDERTASKRPPTYNERMIATGRAAPLYIWPNIDPFRGMKVTDAAMPPQEFRRHVARSGSLQASCRAAAEARAAGEGIYAAANPLQLLAFELRFLAGRRAPDRWVIDLSADDDDPHLIPSDRYFEVPRLEDRLFIPAEYVPLFKAKGWA